MFILMAILVLGGSTRAYELRRSNYVITIEENTLKSIQRTPKSSKCLDLSGLSLQAIDENVLFDDLDTITNLNLSNNNLRHLHAVAFRKFPMLKQLSLANNRLEYFQYAFHSLHHLRTLDIRNNSIKYLYKGSFYGVPKHTKILTAGNDFRDVTNDAFQQPFKLLNFCIDDDGTVHFITEIVVHGGEYVEDINCQTRLRPLQYESVVLSMEGIKAFKKEWYRLNDPTVKSLDLQLNKIDDITSELLNDLPKGLTQVNLALNNITKLNAGVIKNKYLRELDFRYNPISVFEAEAFSDTNLMKLVLSNSKTLHFPKLSYLVLE